MLLLAFRGFCSLPLTLVDSSLPEYRTPNGECHRQGLQGAVLGCSEAGWLDSLGGHRASFPKGLWSPPAWL